MKPAAALAGIALLGVGLRGGAVLALATWRGDAGAYEHAEIARSLALGRGFELAFFSDTPQPSGQQAPAVPFALSLAYRAFGIDTPASRLAFECFAAALSGIGVVAMYLAGAALWNRDVGLWAALLYAVYPPLVYAATRIQAVNWATAFLPAMAACGLRMRRSWSAGWAAGGGLAAGLGMLGEPILGAALGAAGLGLLIAALAERDRARRRRALTAIGALAACTLLVLSPWLVRNAIALGRPTPVKSTFWYVFWQGNNEGASGTDKLEVSPALADRLAWRIGGAGFEEELDLARRQAKSVDTLLSPAERAEIRARATEAERVAWFEDRSLQILREQPGHYLRMCVRRLGQLAWFDPTNPRAFALSYRLPYLVLVAAAAAGLWLCRRFPARHAGPAIAMGLGLVAIHTLVITSARFRLPLETLLMLPAALSAWVLATGLRGARGGSRSVRCRFRPSPHPPAG